MARPLTTIVAWVLVDGMRERESYYRSRRAMWYPIGDVRLRWSLVYE